MLNGVHCRGEGSGCPVANPPLPGSGAPAGYQDYYLRDDGNGAFTATAHRSQRRLAQLSSRNSTSPSPAPRPTCATSSSPPAPRSPPKRPNSRSCESGGPNLYEWSGGALRLVNLLEGDSQGSPDAHLAAQARRDLNRRAARLLQRRRRGLPLSARRRSGRQAASPQDPGATFQTATADGSIAFYRDGGELYRYHALAGSSEPIAAGVNGVLGASADGSTVYFQDAAGLERWHEGTTDDGRPRRRSRPAQRLPAGHRHRPPLRRRRDPALPLQGEASAAMTTTTRAAASPTPRSSSTKPRVGEGGPCAASPATRPASARSAPRPSPARSQTATGDSRSDRHRLLQAPRPLRRAPTASSSTPPTPSSRSTPTTPPTSISGRPREPAAAPRPAAASA